MTAEPNPPEKIPYVRKRIILNPDLDNLVDTIPFPPLLPEDGVIPEEKKE